MNPFTNKQPNVTCLVIEEKSKLQDMAVLLQSVDPSYDFQFCSDYQRAFSILSQDTIDLILLTNFTVAPDVMNAVQFFQRTQAYYPIILLTDAQNTMDQSSLEHENIIDCMLKPIQLDRLQMALHKFRRYQTITSTLRSNESIFIKMGRILRKFYIGDILYVQATGALSTIYTSTTTFTVNESITQLENRLPKHKFSRIHKSYLVGLDHIVGYEKRNALLPDTKLPIGATYRVKLQSIFSLFDS